MAATLPKKLDWIDVESSNVRSIAHDQLTGRIFVMFHSGSTYQYTSNGDPKSVGRDFKEFQQAQSVGSFLNSRIKPFYDYERL